MSRCQDASHGRNRNIRASVTRASNYLVLAGYPRLTPRHNTTINRTSPSRIGPWGSSSPRNVVLKGFATSLG